MLPDLSYAFVSGFNRFIQGEVSHDPNLDPLHPAGGNVGIIRDPFGPEARLVAATRPTPNAFPDNLVLAAGNHLLLAGYRGVDAVFVFDVEQMITTIDETSSEQLAKVPINDLNDKIDVRANYRLQVSGAYRAIPVFDIPAGATNGPIGIDGAP